MNIGTQIKHFRLLKGISQEKLAELLEISPKAYGNIERNITDVNFSRLEQIATVLGINVAKLFNTNQNNLDTEILFLKEKNLLLEQRISDLETINQYLKTQK